MTTTFSRQTESFQRKRQIFVLVDFEMKVQFKFKWNTRTYFRVVSSKDCTIEAVKIFSPGWRELPSLDEVTGSFRRADMTELCFLHVDVQRLNAIRRKVADRTQKDRRPFCTAVAISCAAQQDQKNVSAMSLIPDQS